MSIGESMQIKSKLDQLSNDLNNGSIGELTTEQKKQLKNAAKAHGNNKLLKSIDSKLDDVGDSDALTNFMNDNADNHSQFQSLLDKLDGLASGGVPTDGSGSQLIADSISGVANSVQGISDSIQNLGNGTFNAPAPSQTFGANFLITNDSFTGINADIESLKTQYSEQLAQFKTLFSIDVSGFEEGEYVEHTLDLDVSGSQHSFKSGVLDALLANAEFIYSVVIFICVIVGLKMLGNN